MQFILPSILIFLFITGSKLAKSPDFCLPWKRMSLLKTTNLTCILTLFALWLLWSMSLGCGTDRLRRVFKVPRFVWFKIFGSATSGFSEILLKTVPIIFKDEQTGSYTYCFTFPSHLSQNLRSLSLLFSMHLLTCEFFSSPLKLCGKLHPQIRQLL